MLEAMLGIPFGELPPSIYTRLPDGPYPINSTYSAAAIIGTKVYFEGGKNFRTYDVVTGVWNDGAALKKRNTNLTFSYGTTHVTGGLLHVHGSTAGGIYQPDALAGGSYYNPVTNLWTGANFGGYTTDPSYYGYNVAGAYDPATGVLVTAGGTDFNNAANARLYVADFAAHNFNRYSTPFYALGNGNSAQFVNGAYYFLGAGGLFSKYVKASQAWTQLPNCPGMGGGGVRTTVYKGKIIAYGGGANAAGKKLSIYNPATNTWMAKETGGPGGTYGGLVVYGDTLFIFTGLQVWTVDLTGF